MRINANEGLTEKQLVKVFMNRIGEFYESKSIRLMETNEMDDFMRLLKNHRGGITQIVKRHAKVNIDNTEQATASSEGIYYLDANNLYDGAMHRMMPYELVGVPGRREVMEKINRDPNGSASMDSSSSVISRHQWSCTTSSMTCHSSPYRRHMCTLMESRSTQRRTTSWTK